jgi:dihydrofolate reductase
MREEGVIAVHDVEEALAEAQKHERVFVIGGESVFSGAVSPHKPRNCDKN